MSDELTKSMNHIYKFKIEDGKVKPPTIDFPEFVRERVRFFGKYSESGMNFLGALNLIFAYDEQESKKEFELGAYEDWMPVTDEFKEWRTSISSLRQMEVAVALLYGFEGIDNEEESENEK
ncbi:hypothetical protein ACOJIU_11910 [Carnobacterium maltaromaticum]|uniref:hypothetical protein n=1 Tax=Carnobacterium maltaromaticum TaxID=2751 RepID=UPI003B983E6D